MKSGREAQCEKTDLFNGIRVVRKVSKMGSKDLRILEKKSQGQMKTNINRKYESGIGMQNVQSNVFFLKSSFL